MRWFWIDRFTEFVSGQTATAIKNISLSDEALDDYAPPRAFFPTSLIVEGMAQTGGLLIGQLSDFRDKIVLAKISNSKFYCNAEPGDTLTYRVQIQNQEGIGSVVTGTSHNGDVLHGEIELMFAALDDARFNNVELFEPAQFCRMIRQFKLFDVAVYPDGSPVTVPEYMLQAEKDYLNIG